MAGFDRQRELAPTVVLYILYCIMGVKAEAMIYIQQTDVSKLPFCERTHTGRHDKKRKAFFSVRISTDWYHICEYDYNQQESKDMKGYSY
jgi:hypothetical protein